VAHRSKTTLQLELIYGPMPPQSQTTGSIILLFPAPHRTFYPFPILRPVGLPFVADSEEQGVGAAALPWWLVLLRSSSLPSSGDVAGMDYGAARHRWILGQRQRRSPSLMGGAPPHRPRAAAWQGWILGREGADGF
jgi:hypothetical protein